MELLELRERIRQQKKRQVLELAKLHQQRVQFHTETEVTTPTATQPLNDFFGFVSNILPNDKVKILKSMFRYPVETTSTTSRIFDKLFKIFDGTNAAFTYQFTDSGAADDWDKYRANILNVSNFWQTDGWAAFMHKINSVLIVDVKPGTNEPYFYLLDICNVIDYETDLKGNIVYVAFKQDDERMAVIDDVSYSIYSTDKSGNVSELLVYNNHKLGYCPAKWFWYESLNSHHPDIKKSAISKQLGKLDWLLYFSIAKKHLDNFGAYPIYSGYEAACDYVNEQTEEYCQGGYLKDKRGAYILDSSGLPTPCPICGSKRIVGAGAFIEVPIPTDGQPDLRNPIQMLSADVSSLEYNVKELERLERVIIQSVCGTDGGTLNTQALNEMQVNANFEDRATILKRIKKGFEIIQKFADDTCCRLRYGNKFAGSSIDYGTEFYTLTADELREKYKRAKENGASVSELDALANSIIESEYRNNPQMLQKMRILADIEPFRHKNTDEILQLYEKGLILPNEMQLKLRFDELVKRFERENTSIIDFASETEYSKKIETIKKTLENYVS